MTVLPWANPVSTFRCPPGADRRLGRNDVLCHWFDALVCIPNCDKIIPGMLMAVVRLNVPTIIISGPMRAGVMPDGQTVELISVFQGVGALQAGTGSIPGIW